MSDIEIIPKGQSPKSKRPSLLRLVYIIAAIIVAAWLLGIVLKFAAWIINGLISLAAIVLIIGIIVYFVQKR